MSEAIQLHLRSVALLDMADIAASNVSGGVVCIRDHPSVAAVLINLYISASTWVAPLVGTISLVPRGRRLGIIDSGIHSLQVGKGFNQDYWARFEKFVKDLSKHADDVYVVTGPLYTPVPSPSGGLQMDYKVIGARSGIVCLAHCWRCLALGLAFVWLGTNCRPRRPWHSGMELVCTAGIPGVMLPSLFEPTCVYIDIRQLLQAVAHSNPCARMCRPVPADRGRANALLQGGAGRGQGARW